MALLLVTQRLESWGLISHHIRLMRHTKRGNTTMDKIQEYCLQIRTLEKVPVTASTVEIVLRLAEARAKLRQEVNTWDKLQHESRQEGE